MATITLRSGLSRPLTIAEADANFTNLNNSKIEVTPGTVGNVLTSNGTAWVSQAAGPSGSTLADDTTSNQVQYLGMSRVVSGVWLNAYVASTQLYFNPSTGTLSSTEFQSLSDENAKTDIVTIASAVDTVNQLRGVEFNWVSNGKKSSGVVAQEIEKVLPHLVAEEAGVKSVNYTGLIGYLIEAIKDLNERIEKLENK